jgi:hypothetical protein
MDKHKSILFQLNPNAPTFQQIFKFVQQNLTHQRREVLSTGRNKNLRRRSEKSKDSNTNMLQNNSKKLLTLGVFC